MICCRILPMPHLPQDAVIEQHVTLQSKAVEITVKPLPLENKPADFKGQLGNFTINLLLQKNNITTDDAGNLKIVIEGQGNIQLINAPKDKLARRIDGYDAKITDDIDKFSVPMKGSKTFTYPFTVSKAGTYTIPPVSFSFFDPASSVYKTLHTEPLVIMLPVEKEFANNPYVKNLKAQSVSGTELEATMDYILLSDFHCCRHLLFFEFQRKSQKKKLSC